MFLQEYDFANRERVVLSCVCIFCKPYRSYSDVASAVHFLLNRKRFICVMHPRTPHAARSGDDSSTLPALELPRPSANLAGRPGKSRNFPVILQIPNFGFSVSQTFLPIFLSKNFEKNFISSGCCFQPSVLLFKKPKNRFRKIFAPLGAKCVAFDRVKNTTFCPFFAPLKTKKPIKK